MTHDRLDDLLVDVPAHVTPDPAAAWGSGVRRRRRARVAGGAGAVAVVAVLAALLGLLPRVGDGVQPADGRSDDRVPVGSVVGVPQRIDRQWWVRDLPDRPGPLAGLLGRADGEWLAVSSTGHLWRIDDLLVGFGIPPALSPDGTRLAYPTGTDLDASFVVRDLVTGEVETHPEVGVGASSPEGTSVDPVYVSGSTPVDFSPDGSAVLVHGSPVDDRRSTAAVLDAEHGVRLVPRPDDGFLVGWADDDSLVGYATTAQGTAEVTIHDLDGGGVRRAFELPDAPASLTQWTASMSPDGTVLAVRDEPKPGTTSVTTYDVDDGFRRDVGFASRTATTCAPSWRGYAVLLPGRPGLDGAAAGVLLPTDETAEPTIVADPRLDVVCSAWASNALGNGENRGISALLFGTRDAAVWWWWREELAVLLLGAVLLGVRRYRSRAAHSARSNP